MSPVDPEIKEMRDRLTPHKPTLDDLRRMFFLLLKDNNETFIVIDGLDECPESNDEREGVLRWLEEIVTQQFPGLHILIASRPEADIRDSMASTSVSGLPIMTDSANADIARYVAQQLEENRRLSKLNQTIKKEIENTLRKGATGM